MVTPSTSKAKDPINKTQTDFAKRLTGHESAPLLPPSESRVAFPVDLSQVQKLAFGFGHVINDIMGVLWFSYALLFLQLIAHLSPITSAMLMFLGQFIDAVATPFVGVLVEKYGSKKKWYFLGVILIAVGFPFIFYYWNDTYWSVTLRYTAAIIIFQFGWTLVQITHLSLIPDMIIFLHERTELTTLRYTIFVCSNIAIYLIAYFVFQGRRRNSYNIVDGRDADKFEIIAILAVILGVICSVIFQSVLQMPLVNSSKSTKDSVSIGPPRWRKVFQLCWSSKLLHYVAIVHTASRVFHSLNLVYMPFYINETNVTDMGILAMAPFFSFVGSLAASFVISYTAKTYSNHKVLYTTGVIFALLSSSCVLFNKDRSTDSSMIYVASLFYGIGSAFTIVKSLCIAANFLDTNTEDAAFMYAIVSLFDKVINGILILLVEYIKSTGLINYYHYYKFVLTILSSFVTVVGYIFLQLLPSSICYSSA